MRNTEEKLMVKHMIYSMLPQYKKLCSEVTPEFDAIIDTYVESTCSLLKMLRKSMDTLIKTKNIGDPVVNKLLKDVSEHMKHHVI